MIKGVHHVQVTIPRGAEAQARSFYCELLGLEEIPKPEVLRGRGGFWLRVGSSEVHVGAEDGVARDATKAHVAYEVGVRDETAIPGFRRVKLRDPFGNQLELIDRVGS